MHTKDRPTYEHHFDINRATTGSLVFPRENGGEYRIPYHRFPLSIDALNEYPGVNLGNGLATVIEAKRWFAAGTAFVSGKEVLFNANRMYALKKDGNMPDEQFPQPVIQLIHGVANLPFYFVPVMPKSDKDGPVDTYKFFGEYPDGLLLYPQLPRTPSYLKYLQSLSSIVVPTHLKVENPIEYNI